MIYEIFELLNILKQTVDWQVTSAKTYTQNPEHHQNLIGYSLSHCQQVLGILLKSIYNILSYFANSQTCRQPDKRRQKHGGVNGQLLH